MSGTIRRRGRGSFEIRFDLERINGKRQRRAVTIRGTYKDAQRELTRLLASAQSGTLPDPTRQTIGEYLDQWLRSSVALSPKTQSVTGNLLRDKSSRTWVM